METNNKYFTVKKVGMRDLLEYSDEFINLLNENLMTNFPHKGDLSCHAMASYQELTKYCLDGSAFIFGAFSDLRLVGFIWAYKRIFLGEPRLHVNHIVVDQNYRGMGIGSELLSNLEQVAVMEKIKVIELLTASENTSAVEFYKAHGFNETRVQFEKTLGDV